MSIAKFKVSGHSEGNAKMRVQARDFSMIVDEPSSLGGGNQGATPMEYILAGLVGCLNIVFHLVAREMSIEVRELTIDAEGPIDLKSLFGAPTDERSGYQSITLNFCVDTDASPEELKELIRVTRQRCPVSDTLGQGTPISIRITPQNTETQSSASIETSESNRLDTEDPSSPEQPDSMMEDKTLSTEIALANEESERNHVESVDDLIHLALSGDIDPTEDTPEKSGEYPCT